MRSCGPWPPLKPSLPCTSKGKQIGRSEVRKAALSSLLVEFSRVSCARRSLRSPNPLRSRRLGYSKRGGRGIAQSWCRATPLAADSHGRRLLSRSRGLVAMSAAEAGVGCFHSASGPDEDPVVASLDYLYPRQIRKAIADKQHCFRPQILRLSRQGNDTLYERQFKAIPPPWCAWRARLRGDSTARDG